MGKGESDAAWSCGFACLCCCMCVLWLALTGLGVAQIVIGAMYLHDCSLEKKIPIYLIVAACVPILFGGLGKKDEDDAGLSPSFICALIGYLFNTSWLICGSIWVYPTYSLVHKDTYIPCQLVNGTYTPEGCTVGTCNDTLLTFSFAMVTINWIFIGFWTTLIGQQISTMGVGCSCEWTKSSTFTLSGDTTTTTTSSSKDISLSVISPYERF